MVHGYTEFLTATSIAPIEFEFHQHPRRQCAYEVGTTGGGGGISLHPAVSVSMRPGDIKVLKYN